MMLYSCIICHRNSIKNPSLTFYRQEKTMRSKGCLAMKLKPEELRKQTRICRLHFEDHFFPENNLQCRLGKDAIPSILEPVDIINKNETIERDPLRNKTLDGHEIKMEIEDPLTETPSSSSVPQKKSLTFQEENLKFPERLKRIKRIKWKDISHSEILTRACFEIRESCGYYKEFRKEIITEELVSSII